MEDVDELYNLLLEKMEQAKEETFTAQSGTSAADEILKYKQLMDQGIITEEEFEAKKKQLLAL